MSQPLGLRGFGGAHRRHIGFGVVIERRTGSGGQLGEDLRQRCGELGSGQRRGGGVRLLAGGPVADA
jgi:hypothetical protein